MSTIKDRNGKKVAYTVKYNAVISYADGTQATVLNDTAVTIADAQAAYNAKVPPVVTPTPPIGSGSASLTIDGAKTKYGQVIIVAPGTYTGDITIRNLTNQTVIGDGVIINSAALHLGALTNVTIQGFTIQNTKGKFLYFDSRLVNTTITGLTGLNCTDGLKVGYKVNWDGTDNTVQLLNLTLANCIFNNVGTIYLDGNNWGTPVVNMVKGLEVYACQWANSNAGNMLDSRAIDGFKIHDNIFTNINVTNRDVDTRLIMMCGHGDAYNNTFTETCGHSIAINPLSFSKSVRTVSNFYNNITNHTYKYSQYEVQQFSAQLNSQTQAGDVNISKSVAKDINTDHYAFNGAIVDNYIGNPSDVTDLCVLTLKDCTLQNAWPVPTAGVFWNMEKPSVSSGNVYIP